MESLFKAVGTLINLDTLDFEKYIALTILLDSLKKLKQLHQFILHHYSFFVGLLDFVENLGELEELSLKGYISFANIPKFIGIKINLSIFQIFQSFNFKNCSNITKAIEFLR